MRWLLLLGVIALAAAVVRAEDVIEDDEELDLLDSLDEDANIDVKALLSELFTFDDQDDIDHDSELGINRDARAMEDESALEQKAAVDPADQARYNKFIDTFFRRLNADARSSIDPLVVPIVAKKKTAKKEDAKKGRKKDPAPKKGKKKSKKGDKKKTKKSKKNKKKNVKKGRHPKSLSLEGEDEDEEAAEVETDAEQEHHVDKREAELVEEIEDEEEDDDEEALERQERSADDQVEDEEDDTDAAISRAGKPMGNKGKKAKKGGKRKGGKKGGKKSGSKKSGGKKKGNKKSGKKSNKKSKRSAKKGAKTSRASVTGIATVTRLGDVAVVNRKDGKELRTQFKIGPVNLKVNRRFGRGKDAIVRSASAESPELTGKMHLAVAANGRAKITKFMIQKPSVVTVDGSINKNENDLRKGNNFLENSIGRITPKAALKLKLTARKVLQATESKN